MDNMKRDTDEMGHLVEDAGVAARELAAWDIMGRIGGEGLGPLTVRRFRTSGDVAPTLHFEALLLPFRRSDGQRATGRVWMEVQVTAVGDRDVFDALVFFYAGGRYRGHCKAQSISGEVLGRFVASLEYDGPEILDPEV